MALTSEEIKALSERRGAKAIAVQNFLGTLGDMSRGDALANLTLDAGLYKWNAATKKAIRDGILKHFG